MNKHYKQLANELNITEEEAELIIKTHWKVIRGLIRESDKPRILLNGFGSFSISLKSLNYKLKYYYIPKLREGNYNSKLKEQFKLIWKLRKKLLSYHKT